MRFDSYPPLLLRIQNVPLVNNFEVYIRVRSTDMYVPYRAYEHTDESLIMAYDLRQLRYRIWLVP